MEFRAINTVKVGGEYRVPGTDTAIFEWDEDWGDPGELVSAGLIAPEGPEAIDVYGAHEATELQEEAEITVGHLRENHPDVVAAIEEAVELPGITVGYLRQNHPEVVAEIEASVKGDSAAEEDSASEPLPFEPESVKVGELEEELAKIDDVETLHALQQADTRSTAAAHYERRISELQEQDEG